VKTVKFKRSVALAILLTSATWLIAGKESYRSENSSPQASSSSSPAERVAQLFARENVQQIVFIGVQDVDLCCFRRWFCCNCRIFCDKQIDIFTPQQIVEILEGNKLSLEGKQTLICLIKIAFDQHQESGAHIGCKARADWRAENWNPKNRKVPFGKLAHDRTVASPLGNIKLSAGDLVIPAATYEIIAALNDHKDTEASESQPLQKAPEPYNSYYEFLTYGKR
jgi:hypothetical protein